MEKAVLLYDSKTGTTESYARSIGAYLQEKEIKVQAASIQEYDQEILEDTDYVLLGAWTKGLMVIFQHPDAVWKESVASLPPLPGAKLALFTTYKLRTGSMFKNMKRELNGNLAAASLTLKSRTGSLSQQDQAALDLFIGR